MVLSSDACRNCPLCTGEKLDLEHLHAGTQTVPSHLEVDGAIGYMGLHAEFDDLVKKNGWPMINMSYEDVPGMPRVSPDNEAVARLAVRHFQERGLKRICFYQTSHRKGEEEKMLALRNETRRMGLEFFLLTHSNSEAPTKPHLHWLGDTIRELPKPLGIMAEFDDPAIEVLHACRQANVPVPSQVECLEGRKPASQVLRVPPRGVVARQSTDIFAVEHHLVAKVIQTIRERFTQNIVAKEIAAAVPLSYRRLHDAFLRTIGHSLAEEISLQRIRRAQQLLVDTDKKAEEIAQLSGFTSQDRMGKVFMRVIGSSPHTYRQRFKSR